MMDGCGLEEFLERRNAEYEKLLKERNDAIREVKEEINKAKGEVGRINDIRDEIGNSEVEYDREVREILEKHGIECDAVFHEEKDHGIHSIEEAERRCIKADWKAYDSKSSDQSAAGQDGAVTDSAAGKGFFGSIFSKPSAITDKPVKVIDGPDKDKLLSDVLSSIDEDVRNAWGRAQVRLSEIRARSSDLNAGAGPFDRDYSSRYEQAVKAKNDAEDRKEEIGKSFNPKIESFKSEFRKEIDEYIGANPWIIDKPSFQSSPSATIAIGSYAPDASKYRLVGDVYGKSAEFPIVIRSGMPIAIGPDRDQCAIAGVALKILSSYPAGSLRLRLVDPDADGMLARIQRMFSGESGGASEQYITVDGSLERAKARENDGNVCYVVVGRPDCGAPAGSICVVFCDPSEAWPGSDAVKALDGRLEYRGRGCKLVKTSESDLKSWAEEFSTKIPHEELVLAKPDIPVERAQESDNASDQILLAASPSLTESRIGSLPYPEDGDRENEVILTEATSIGAVDGRVLAPASDEPDGPKPKTRSDSEIAIPVAKSGDEPLELIFDSRGPGACGCVVSGNPAGFIETLVCQTSEGMGVGNSLLFLISPDADMTLLKSGWEHIGMVLEMASAGDLLVILNEISDEVVRRKDRRGSPMFVEILHADKLLAPGDPMWRAAAGKLASIISECRSASIFFVLTVDSADQWNSLDGEYGFSDSLGCVAECGSDGSISLARGGERTNGTLIEARSILRRADSDSSRSTVVSSDASPLRVGDAYGRWTYGDFVSNAKWDGKSRLCAIGRGCFFGEIIRLRFDPTGSLTCVFADGRMSASIVASVLKAVASSQAGILVFSPEGKDGVLGSAVAEIGPQVNPPEEARSKLESLSGGEVFVVLHRCPGVIDPSSYSDRSGIHIIVVDDSPPQDTGAYLDLGSKCCFNAVIGGGCPEDSLGADPLLASMLRGIQASGGQETMALVIDRDGHRNRFRPFFHRCYNQSAEASPLMGLFSSAPQKTGSSEDEVRRIVKRVLDGANVKYEVADDHIISTGFMGDDLPIRMIITTENSRLAFVCLLDLVAEQSAFPKVTWELNRINSSLAFGAFYMNHEDGHIYFEYAFPYATSPVTDEFVATFIRLVAQVVDDHDGDLKKLAESGCSRSHDPMIGRGRCRPGQTIYSYIFI